MSLSDLALRRPLFLLLLLLLIPFASSGAVSKVKTESGMLVKGSIEISAAGQVLRHTLDQPERLPEPVRRFADSLIPTLRFDPVETPDQTPTRSQMRLYFVAADNGNGGYAIRLRDAWFDSEKASDTVVALPRSAGRMQPPRGPLPMPMTATVYLALKVDRQGTVADIDVSHVDFGVSGPERLMKQWRRTLGDLVTDFVKKARFAIPTTGPDADREYWTGLYAFPISITGDDDPPKNGSDYGRWQTFVPGPRKEIPWLDPQAAGAGKALLADGFNSSRPHRQLTTLPDG